MTKIIKLEAGRITFDDGHTISSNHNTDCCEWHEIDASGISIEEVKDLEFDLSLPFEELIQKVEGYGIRINPINNFPLSVPAYGYNNGYYGNNIDLILSKGNKVIWEHDITECQEEKY